MSWVEQCRSAFRTRAQSLLLKQEHKDVRRVIKQLASESGISQATLRRWWRGEGPPSASRTGVRMGDLCLQCGEHKVDVVFDSRYRTKRYIRTKKSKHYGLCRRCVIAGRRGVKWDEK